jgi:hypothetical protein
MGDLRKFMQSLKQQYTQWFNRAHERTGTLWECRYHSVIVEGAVMDDSGHSGLSHAARVVAAYIDLNPVRAGMVEVKVRRGKMPLRQVLRLRVRYMTAGGVIGSEAFVRQVYEGANDVLSRKEAKRKRKGGVPMRNGDWGGLHVLRDLREPVG